MAELLMFSGWYVSFIWVDRTEVVLKWEWYSLTAFFKKVVPPPQKK